MTKNDEPSTDRRLPPPAALSIADAAHYLGLGETAFREHVAAQLPKITVGRRVIFRVVDLDAWLAQTVVRQEAERNAPRTYGARRPSSPRPLSATARELLRPPREYKPKAT